MHCFPYISSKIYCTSIALYPFWVMKYDMPFWEVEIPVFAPSDYGVYLASISKRFFSLIDLVDNISHVM